MNETECSRCSTLDVREKVFRCAHIDGKVLVLHYSHGDYNPYYICECDESHQSRSSHGGQSNYRTLEAAEAAWPAREEAFLKGVIDLEPVA